MLLVAIVRGFAISTALYQLNREAARSSALLGAVLCGPQQRVDDVPGTRRARRMICRNEQGREVSPRNNALPFLMALPFILVLAVPGVWFATRANIQERRR